MLKLHNIPTTPSTAVYARIKQIIASQNSDVLKQYKNNTVINTTHSINSIFM